MTIKNQESANKNTGITRRDLLIAAGGTALGGYADRTLVKDDTEKESVERMFRDMVATSKAGDEYRSRYSVNEILSAFLGLDMFSIDGTTPEDESKQRSKMLNMNLPNIPYATSLSGSYEQGNILDAVVSLRLAEDSVDKKEGANLSHLVKGLLKEGAIPTDQTIRLANERIEKSRERIGGDYSNTIYKDYDWKRDAEILEQVKAELIKAKYAARSQNAPAVSR